MAAANVPSPPTSVDEYIASFPAEVRERLARVRAAIRRVVPDTPEKISYGMPAIMLDGRHAVYFAAWKKHIGVYPVYRSDDPIEEDLAPYRDAKDTLRFPFDEPLPEELIERVVHHVNRRAAGGHDSQTAR